MTFMPRVTCVGAAISAVTSVDSVRISLAWARQFAELLSPIGCLQFHSLSKVLRPGQAHRETETVLGHKRTVRETSATSVLHT